MTAPSNDSAEVGGESPLSPVRLAYEIWFTGRTCPIQLRARLRPDTPILGEGDLKQLLPNLHALDQAVVSELRSAVNFGQIADGSLARLLPLLAQRRTLLHDRPMEWRDEVLRPRLRVTPASPEGLRVRLGFESDSEPWLDTARGRLVAGTQAFLLLEHVVTPVASPVPWELQAWAKSDECVLGSNLTPIERDRWVSDLMRIGIPSADLALLAVQRGPPEHFCLTLVPEASAHGLPIVRARLEAVYAGQRTRIEGRRPQSHYLEPPSAGTTGLVERDLVAEDEARRILRRARFHFDPDGQEFVAREEAALRALDPHVQIFPTTWEVDRSASTLAFRQDLELRAQVQLLPERGALDLRVEAGLTADEQTADTLIGMRDLLLWLQSHRSYLRLSDGTYVAPSRRFRQSLRLLTDLGAETGRALVSPLCVGLLRLLGDQAALAVADAATHAWLTELAGGGTPMPVAPPGDLEHILRDYQKHGLDWLAMLHRYHLTGILADDMGLGKTVQALALLWYLRQRDGPQPSLVVAPTSVLTVWRDEASRFTPDLRVAIWHGDAATRRALPVSELDLLVTSYGVLRRDADLLASHRFRYVILDEAQSAKNASTQNARAVRRLSSAQRLALTGTPIENCPEELWATFDFLAPGFLFTLRQFRKRYGSPIARGDVDALSLLRARIQPLVLRRLKSEVARELPPKVESTVRCQMLPAQRALYDHVADRLRQNVRRQIERLGIQRAQLGILAALTRLRQICCDPFLLGPPAGTKVPGSAKLDLFTELMREALASERRVVVFSQFVQMQKRLIAVVRRLGVEPLWLHGGTRHRDKVVEAFQRPSGPPVIVVSLRAGGTGLTMTRADTVMHYDPWWNPAVERQATDRAHRLGQQHQVTVYRLVCADSVEEKVVALAEQKEALAEDLLGSSGQTGAKRISMDEVLALLG